MEQFDFKIFELQLLKIFWKDLRPIILEKYLATKKMGGFGCH